MNIEERRKGWILCEICGEEPSTNIKGGIYNNESKMWMICKNCVSKIKDQRLK